MIPRTYARYYHGVLKVLSSLIPNLLRRFCKAPAYCLSAYPRCTDLRNVREDGMLVAVSALGNGDLFRRPSRTIRVVDEGADMNGLAASKIALKAL